MGSGENSNPTPLASQPLARKMVRTKGESARRRPRRLPEAGGSQFHAAMQTIESAAWQGKVRSDIPSFISEVFKEELSYRAQARKFLWEFFD